VAGVEGKGRTAANARDPGAGDADRRRVSVDYEPPHLAVLGTMAALTHGNPDGPTTDGLGPGSALP